MEQSSPKILTKKLQSLFSSYFFSSQLLSKPEKRCLKDMTMGILKSKSVFVNQIASSLKEKLKLKDVAKRLSAHYLKDDFWEKVTSDHVSCIDYQIEEGGFMTLDESDIIKKHSRCMEGLEYIKDGDTNAVGLGYKLVNVNYINRQKEIIPLYSKAYSYQMGAKSSNMEIKDAVRFLVEKTTKSAIWVFDRGMDNQILKDFFVGQLDQFILRLKRSTKLYCEGEQIQVEKIKNKMRFNVEQTVSKIKGSKRKFKTYKLGATKVQYKNGREFKDLWLVVSKNQRHGGICYLLTKSNKETELEVIKEAFKGYGLRWKIEEYHRHIKQEYKLEDVQMKTFSGIQSMLAVLTVAMNIIYNEIKSIHISLLLDSGHNYLNKYHISELTNFIYYKIGKIVSNLLIPVRLRHKIAKSECLTPPDQLNLCLF